MSATTIEWADYSWNSLRGCSLASPGCQRCYAQTIARRFSGPGKPFEGLINRHGRWNGVMRQAPERTLLAPLSWRAPRRIFANSMTDWAHENVPDEWIDPIFGVMALCAQHTFILLTKRAERMQRYCSQVEIGRRIWHIADEIACKARLNEWHPSAPYLMGGALAAPWPLPNVWLGVSVEDQERADERIPLLLQTPAAVRFLSCEPILGPIDLTSLPFREGDPRHRQNALSGQADLYFTGCNGNPDVTVRTEPLLPRLDWIITGGESGPGARPMHPEWVRAIRNDCVEAGVAFFFKQWGEWAPHGTPHPGEVTSTFVDGEPPAHMLRIGKKRAGRELDGRKWDEFPKGAVTA